MLCSSLTASMSISITVMTFNLHRDGAEDEPNSWQYRKDIYTTIILKYTAVVVCIQEALQSQLEDNMCKLRIENCHQVNLTVAKDAGHYVCEALQPKHNIHATMPSRPPCPPSLQR